MTSTAGRQAVATGRVLVVDDLESNREFLRDLLEADGHEVLEAADGLEAVRLATEGQPDVVLLDVNMPQMDGYEVARRLKAAERTAAIPLLLVTALSDREKRLEGIAAGANDYLTKPIDRTDLILRTRNAIRMRHISAALEAQYRRLQDLEQLRDNLVHMIVHDLRSPLTAIQAYLQLIKLDAGDQLGSEIAESIDEVNRVAVTMSEMVSDLLDVSRLEAGLMPLARAEVDFGTLIVEAIASVGAAGRVAVRFEPPPQQVRVFCDPAVIRRVIANLVANAVKFSPQHGEVRVSVAADPAQVRLTVADDGPGIPPAYQQKIFEKFGQVEAARQGAQRSSGLGLTFCKLSVEAHNGRIGVESEAGKGSTFWFALPRTGPDDPSGDHESRVQPVAAWLVLISQGIMQSAIPCC